VSGPSATSAPATATPSRGPAAETDGRHRRALRLRQTLVVALAVLSGATDAIGLMALGGAFTSVMTGNLVILGASASATDGALAIASGGAILAFCAGAALGARVAGSPQAGDPVWPRAVSAGLAIELVLYAGFAVCWWVADADPGQVLRSVLLVTLAVALGIQSSTVQRFGVGGLSTTYLTGTLTTVVIRLASGRGLREVRGSVEILLGLVVGAAAGTALLLVSPMTAPALPLTALAAVLLVAAVVARRR